MSQNVRLSEPIWNATKTLGFLAVSITLTFLVTTAALSTGALAQESTYNYGYYTNANLAGVPDASMFVVNPGSKGGTSPGGDLCANIYVLSADQQMQECCSCKVTPNGLIGFSLNKDLTSNPFSGPLTVGAIKIVSSAVPSSGSCQERRPAFSGPDAGTDYKAFGLLGTWITHVHQTTVGAFSVSETGFFPSGLPDTELTKLQDECFALVSSGTGRGICSCGRE
jgi:hypothetical protein